jgi:FtsP/CotA-like multicopper oxidase with cupredoxin domain
MKHYLPRLTHLGNLSRRSVLKGLGTTAAMGAAAPLVGCALPNTPLGPDLRQPVVRKSAGGLLDTKIDARIGTYDLGGKTVHLRGFDGGPVGPTLRIEAGDTLRLQLNNNLPFDPVDYLCTPYPVPGENAPRGLNVTNMHVHGVHVSPRAPADDIFLLLRHKESFNYVYDVHKGHPPGTYFYHTHFHGSVALQVASGMSGALIILGEMDTIPEIAAAKDQVIVIQTQRFNDEGICDNYETLLKGNQFYVNGQVNPVIRVRPGEVQRWRLVNASHAFATDLRLEETTFTALCYDGNPLPKSQLTDHVLLIPGNRADVLIKGGEPGVYRLDGGEGVGTLATVIVEGETEDMPLFEGALPEIAALRPISEDEVTYGRRLEFGMTDGPPNPNYLINNQPFSCTETWKIPLNAVEEWEVYNHTEDPHPFHIHINPFQVVSGGGVEPGIWLDTLELPPFERITFRTRFSTYTGKFVFHCHNLIHEDMGMMQAVEVVAPEV